MSKRESCRLHNTRPTKSLSGIRAFGELVRFERKGRGSGFAFNSKSTHFSIASLHYMFARSHVHVFSSAFQCLLMDGTPVYLHVATSGFSHRRIEIILTGLKARGCIHDSALLLTGVYVIWNNLVWGDYIELLH